MSTREKVHLQLLCFQNLNCWNISINYYFFSDERVQVIVGLKRWARVFLQNLIYKLINLVYRLIENFITFEIIIF